jgi:hypothetical protein
MSDVKDPEPSPCSEMQLDLCELLHDQVMSNSQLLRYDKWCEENACKSANHHLLFICKMLKEREAKITHYAAMIIE